MALIGFGDFDDMFGGVDRMMNNMMRSMLGSMPDPFGMMDNMLMRQNMNLMRSSHFMNVPSGFQMMMTNIPNSSYSYSSSMTRVSTDERGRSQIYQATQSSRCGPDGAKETRSTIQDSASGFQQMSIGHHINDRAHIMQRSRNVYTGEEEHQDDYVNLDEEDESKFESEWQQHMSRGYNPSYHRALPRIPRENPNTLALPAPPPVSASSHHSREVHNVGTDSKSNRKSKNAGESSPSTSKGKMAHKHKNKRDKRPYEKY